VWSVNVLVSAGLLPGDNDAQWSPVMTGESGATVLRDAVGRRYAKVVAPQQRVVGSWSGHEKSRPARPESKRGGESMMFTKRHHDDE